MRFYLIILLLSIAVIPSKDAWAAREIHVQLPTTIDITPDTRIIADDTGMIIHAKRFQAEDVRPAVEIDVITGGGCSPEAQAQGCLGPPASFKTYTVYLGDDAVFAIGVNIMLLKLSKHQATLEIVVPGSELFH